MQNLELRTTKLNKMNTEILNKIANKKLTRITAAEIDEAARAILEAVAEITSLPSEEEQIAQLNLRFGFLKNSLLHLTAKFADAESTETILKIAATNPEDNFEIVNARDESLFTPLHFAARSGDPLVAQLLLDAGAENNPQASTENRHWTPIHYAAQFGHAGVVETLINASVDKEVKTGFGLTPLLVGAEFGQLSVVKLMLKLRADKNAQTVADNHCMNALHYAVVGNFRDVAITLLKAGINREQKTNSDLSALDLAIQSDQPDMVTTLLTWGVGNIDHAFKFATEIKSNHSLERIKHYIVARKNLFDATWLMKFSKELIETLKKCDQTNFEEVVIVPSANAPLNACGILALQHEVGFFSKSTETFSQFCAKTQLTNVVLILRAIEQMLPKS